MTTNGEVSKVRVYIATSSNERGIDQWRALAKMLKANGHVITYDWTIDVDCARVAGRSDASLSPQERKHYAQADFNGVLSADILVYIAPEEKSEGSAYELGVMHARRACIGGGTTIVVGNARTLFAELSTFKVGTLEDAASAIEVIAKNTIA